ncbi:MAG: hypothetical protein EPN23_10875 [Verrucomicrobia bacterium]|nr:MAG: hypothetical protein EPN23_10875 [Verrucomicrobiota bacterium]
MSTDELTGATGEKRPPNLPLRPDQLISLARGFAWMGWGLLATFLLLLGLLEWHLPRLLAGLPSYAIGATLTLFGGMLWWRAAEQTRPWQRHARLAVALAALQIYFAPFVRWWRHDLNDIQLYLNSMALPACLMLLAWTLARQAEETGRMLADHALVTEARLGRRTLILPVLALTMLLAAYETAVLADMPLPKPISVALPGMAMPPWLMAAYLGAISMTVSLCWRATHACHHALVQSAKLSGKS